jgi:hypothetical protein
MSNPPNPLDKYRSHSVHHILLVGATTEDLRTIIAKNFISTISGKKLGEEIGSNVYLLLDSRRISEFYIESIEYTSQPAGDFNSGISNTAVMASEVIMSVVDPSGVGFINYLNYLSNFKMKQSILGFQFLLVTMFIGHTDNGSTELISNIVLPMISTGLASMTEFTSKGSKLQFSFALSQISMGQSMPGLTSLPHTITYKGKEKLLGTAVQSFENAINQASVEWWSKLQVTPPAENNSSDQPQVQEKSISEAPKGKLVQYMFTMPEEWFMFSILSSEDSTTETNFKQKIAETKSGTTDSTPEKVDTTDASNNAYMASAVNASIHDELNILLSKSPEVVKKANGQLTPDGLIKTFKLATTMTSNDEYVLIHFDVVEYTHKNANVNKDSVKDKTDTTSTAEQKPSDESRLGIVFDYLFSGKNVDILDIEIRLDNLFAYGTTSSGIGAPADNVLLTPQTKKENIIVDTSSQKTSGPLKEKDIVQSPVSTKYDLANNNDLGSLSAKQSAEMYSYRQNFHKVLSFIHSTSVQPTVKIRGNPDLLKTFSVESIAPHIKIFSISLDDYTKSIKTLDQTAQYTYGEGVKLGAKGDNPVIVAHLEHRKYIDSLIVSDTGDITMNSANNSVKAPMLNQSILAKINIFAPTDYPFSTEDKSSYKTQFFYDGWYMISAITSNFDGASFTQQLSLQSLDVYAKYV